MEEQAAKNEIHISQTRLLVSMAAFLVVLLVGSLFIAPWRVSVGLLLGGILSFLNFYWIKISLESVLNRAATEQKASFNASFYILRYAVIAIIIFIAAQFNIASVAATLLGLLSFAFAVLLEAIIQLYLTIVNREET